MRTLMLPVGLSSRERGRMHGEMFRGAITTLAELRLYLTIQVGGFANEDEVLQVAQRHLPVLQEYDAALYDELTGIAEGSGLSPAHLVVLNHYTDLRDLNPKANLEVADADGGCSVLFARTPEGPVLAQTWDMHATAIPYVMMMRVDGAWLLTLTGCLGMAGMSRSGVAIAINNLHSTDARVGVVWSALVRRALREPTATGARDAVLNSPVGSGHHYMVADEQDAFAIETSGTLRKVIFSGEADQYVHTNHCLDSSIARASRVPPKSTSYDRLDLLQASIAARPVSGVHDAWNRLGSEDGYPRSVCTNMSTPQNPHAAATCAAIAMSPHQGTVWAEGGLIHNVEPTCFSFEPESEHG